jgi:Uncharacterized protein conserved in bacteria (DUF2321)
MSLSDACFEFTQTLVAASHELLEAVEWYADSPLAYGDEISALRQACLDVQRTPWSPDAAATLIRLATSVIGYHDTPPYTPGEIQRRAEMRQLIDILRPALDDADALEVKRLLPDVVGETTETGKAASRLRVILAKVGKATYEVAIKVLTDIASETAKKMLGLKL